MGKKFITQDVVRMHDTDAAGILYFARVYRFAHDALEEFMTLHDLSLRAIVFSKSLDFMFVMVHSEADYLTCLTLGDPIEIHLSSKEIGTSSFTLFCEIYKKDKTLAATVTMVFVTLDKKTRKKIPLPDTIIKPLEEYYGNSPNRD